LAGIKVVEICHSIAGPYAGSILAQLGADVVKVEHPTKGDDARKWAPPFLYGTSAIFQAMNRDKRGITVDMKSADECAELRRFIIEEVDVVVQSLRPGAVYKLGIDGAGLLAEKPSLVYCNLGAFGSVGPLKDKPGYDPLMQARSGLMSLTGEDGREPVRIGTSIIDMGTGMWVAIGVLSALVQRGVTGRGSLIDASLYETSLAWMKHTSRVSWPPGKRANAWARASPKSFRIKHLPLAMATSWLQLGTITYSPGWPTSLSARTGCRTRDFSTM
jgi:crotonobetainyl-CoA:carnitine CoA-transferase CaiB-like acyl-CoA transferase